MVSSPCSTRVSLVTNPVMRLYCISLTISSTIYITCLNVQILRQYNHQAIPLSHFLQSLNNLNVVKAGLLLPLAEYVTSVNFGPLVSCFEKF